MDLNHLKSFIKIADTNTLRKAADTLHISQSALSSQIKLLEERLGLALFIRTAKGMILTENGRILYSYAREVINSASLLSEKAKTLTGKALQSVKVGINTDGSFLKVSKLSRTLTNHFPHINFVFVSSQTIKTAEMLREELIDIGFFFGENTQRDIHAEIIDHFHIQIAIPNTILPPKDDINWKVLAPLPWIWSVCNCPYYQIVQAKMDSLGLEPNRFIDAMDESVVKELVMDNQGIAILREDDAQYVAELCDITIWEDEKFKVPLSIGRLKNNADNEILSTISRLIKELWTNEG